MNTLTRSEQSAFRQCEQKILQGITMEANSWLVKGEGLKQIRDDGYYRITHNSFDDYCQERWGFAKSHGHRFITGYETYCRLSPIGDSVPKIESHIREVQKAPKDKQAEVVQRAQEIAAIAEREPIAKDYEEARIEIAPPERKKPKSAKPKQGSEKVAVKQMVDSLYKQHMPPLVRGIDAVAKTNGGKGPMWKEANDCLNRFAKAVKEMGKGKK